MSKNDVGTAANRLHHLSMLYVGAFCEMAQGKPLGMVPKDFPGLSKSRDFIDIILFCRAEISGLTACLVKAGVFTIEEYTAQVAEEYEHLAQAKAKQFGVKIEDAGLVFSVGQG